MTEEEREATLQKIRELWEKNGRLEFYTDDFIAKKRAEAERTGSSTQPLNKPEQESMNPRVKDTQ